MCLVILLLCCRCCHKMTKTICQLSDEGFNIFVFIIPRNWHIKVCLEARGRWHLYFDVDFSQSSRSHLQMKSGDRQTKLLIKAANSGRAARPGIHNPFIIPKSFKPEYQYHPSQCRISKPLQDKEQMSTNIPSGNWWRNISGHRRGPLASRSSKEDH